MNTDGLDMARVRSALNEAIGNDPDVTIASLEAGANASGVKFPAGMLEDFLSGGAYIRDNLLAAVASQLLLEREDFETPPISAFSLARGKDNLSPARRAALTEKYRLSDEHKDTTLKYVTLHQQDLETIGRELNKRIKASGCLLVSVASSLGMKSHSLNSLLYAKSFNPKLQDRFLDLCGLLSELDPQTPPLTSEEYLRHFLKNLKVNNWEKTADTLIALNAHFKNTEQEIAGASKF